MDKIETLLGGPSEKLAGPGSYDGIPTHVGQDRCSKPFYCSRPQCEPGGVDPMLDPVGEHNLHPHTDAQYRLTGRDPIGYDFITTSSP